MKKFWAKNMLMDALQIFSKAPIPLPVAIGLPKAKLKGNLLL